MKKAYISILGSQAGAQALLLLATPWLTRLYSREEFGLFGLATTAALVLSTFVSGRLEQSLHTASNTRVHYTHSRQVIFLVASLLCIPALLVFSYWTIFSNALLIVIFAATHASYLSSLIFLNREQAFTHLVAVNLSLPIVFLAGTLAQSLIATEPKFNELLFWQAIAHVVAATMGHMLALSHRNPDAITSRTRFNLQVLYCFVKTHFDDYRFLVPSQVLSILALNISVLGSAWLFGSATAGLLFVAQRVSRLPVSMIGNALNEVLRSTISSGKSTTTQTTFDKISYISSGLGTIIIFAAWLIPTAVIVWGLGDEWADLKVVLLFTTIAGAFQLLGTSVNCLLTLFAKMTDFLINLSLLAGGILAVGLAHFFQLTLLNYLAIHSIVVGGIYFIAYLKARQLIY